MAKNQLTLPGEIVKKHNHLIRSKININSKTASRILACLIASIRHDDKHFKETYTVPIKDYLPTEDSKQTYKLAKDACRELARATVETEWLEPDTQNDHPVFHVMPFFTSIKYRKGNVEAKFNPEMKDLLLQLTSLFTQYNLSEFLALPSTYSQKLFEILKSWANAKNGEVILSMQKLHHLLNTPESFRADFRQFRTRVLEKAHKDIQEKTSLRYEWEPIKVGRSVESIHFTFEPGRKALAEKEKKKAAEDKKRRLDSQRFLRAIECARSKKGNCAIQDNKPIICRLCRQFFMREEIRKKS